MKLITMLAAVGLLAAAIMATACGEDKKSNDTNAAQSLSEEQKHTAANALKELEVAEGLQVQLMAAEPVIKNPTNIDVDDRGRVWVTEAFNYRPDHTSTTNPQGDRIMILEDKDGDGIAEVNKAFYQGPEINAPLGICLVGKRVIVAQSPYVWVFYDDDGDDKADRKEILFQGIEGEQHDHGMHTFTSGPDGKLYFNFGANGVTLRDRHNKLVFDQYGDSISSPKYKMGMVFRCDPDGSNVERLGDNFRNNYEVAVDSYGTMWQSDNDDDGNRSVRINYVMDYGNFGYTDEMTGAWWSVNRTNIEDSVPFRHWHQNDPGVIPNLLQTGSGSPAGMIVYEGDLLPEKYRRQVIHCEAGHNVVRAYPVKKDGAGFTASIENILTGDRDQWFRPVDVCVAPDGSLIVADWYDPVVGGHEAKDKESGRIFRIAPKGVRYTIPVFDYTTVKGAISALSNPNLAVRRNAWEAIQAFGGAAVPALEEIWKSSTDNRMKARAFWALVKLPGGAKYIDEAIIADDPDIRMCGLRAARQLHQDVIPLISRLVHDKDPQVRRECAIALHKNTSPEAPALWAQLAMQHDGRDRWYLEALGIGAANNWDKDFASYLQKVPDPLQTIAGKDIVWRARTDKSLPFLVALAGDEHTDLKSRLRYFRAFDFNGSPAKTAALLAMIGNNKKSNTDLNGLLLAALNPAVVQHSSIAKHALNTVLASVYGTRTYTDLVKQYELTSATPQLLQLALDKPADKVAAEAVRVLYHFKKDSELWAIINGRDEAKALKLLTAFGGVGSSQVMKVYKDVLLGSRYSDTLRKTAALMMGRTMSGEQHAYDLAKAGKLPVQFTSLVLKGLEQGPRRSMYLQVAALVSKGEGGKPRHAFDREAVLSLKGDATRGAKVFQTICSVCHQVDGAGTDFGPKLSAIGSKFAKDGLLDAVMDPSGGISFGYETTELHLKDGSVMTGLIASKTENSIDLKLPGGSIQKINTHDIKLVKQTTESMMPALHEAMATQDLADLLQFLSTLKKVN